MTKKESIIRKIALKKQFAGMLAEQIIELQRERQTVLETIRNLEEWMEDPAIEE